MTVRNWNTSYGLFSSDANWTPGGAPAAGDTLYVSSGIPILFNETFGSAAVRSTIGLVSTDASQPAGLIAWATTLTDVTIDNTPPAGADFTGRHGVLGVIGTTTNDGGTIEAGRGGIGGNSLDIVIAPGSTLVNRGTIGALPNDTMAISDYGGSALENDGTLFAAGGKVTVGTDLTGTGTVSAGQGQQSTGSVELQAAAGAGQTFDLGLAGVLQVDQPMSFLGQVALQGGKVSLEGLSVQSWDENGSVIDVFDASGGVIDTLRLTAPQDPATLKVYAAPDPTYGSAVTVGAGPFVSPPPNGILLPYHTAAAAA